MRLLFATPELAPLVRVGGLSYAAAGLIGGLVDAGVDVTVVLPDYGTYEAGLGAPEPLPVPAWVGLTELRRGNWEGVPLIALRPPGMARPHPYTDANGNGWHDNDFRFMAFSAGVAALARELAPDVLHLNDWHTGATIGFLPAPPPTVLTIHNLGYQGITHAGWREVLINHPEAYEWWGGTNPMSGAIALADAIVTVSPRYAEEILQPEHGAGLHEALRARRDALVGIRNGIDTAHWDPAADPYLPRPFSSDDLRGKAAARAGLLSRLGWPRVAEPVIGMVTRLAHHKGVDLALAVPPHLATLPARMVLLGSGEAPIAAQARWATVGREDRFAFLPRFDEPLAHHIFAGADLFLMPSRSEPCGLAQMQAMTYGTIPVVTDVGGLHDTVVDADLDPERGTGIVASTVSEGGVVDAVHRAVRAWRSPRRRRTIQRRGMTRDWSWRIPARQHVDLYQRVAENPNLRL